MRSQINTIIILISIVLLIFLAYKGVTIGDIQVLSISALIQKNDFLSQKLEEATLLTTQDYPDNISKMEENFQKYLTQKQKYEQLVKVTHNDKQTYQTKQYDISYLWRVLGAYAKNRGVSLALDVKKSNVGTNAYDLNFNISGEYTGIINFIVDLESDSDLRFRIYDFKIEGKAIKEKVNDKEIIKVISNATFSVKGINIDSSTIAKSSNNK